MTEPDLADLVPGHGAPPAGEASSPQRSHLGGAARIVAGNLTAYLANGVLLLVTATLLGASGRGVYSGLLLWATAVTSLSTLSVGPAIAREASRDRRLPLPRLVQGYVVLTGVSTAATLAVYAYLPDKLHLDGPAVVALVLFAPSVLALDWSVYLLQGLGRASSYGVARALPQLLGLAATLVASVTTQLTPGLAIWTTTLGFLSAAVVASAIVARSAEFRALLPLSSAKEVLGGGLRAHIGTVSSLLNARLDLAVVSLALSTSQTGSYSVAVSLTVPLALLGASTGTQLFRAASRERTSRAFVGRLYARVWLGTAALGAVAALGALAIPLALGHAYTAAVVPCVVLALGTCGLGVMSLSVSLLQAYGRAGTASLALLGAAALSGGLLAGLVPALGLVGAALSSAITYVVTGSAMTYTVWRLSS